MDYFFLKEKIENSHLPYNNMNFSTTGDGRLDSAESEGTVIKHLQSLFKGTDIKVFIPPAKRWWYDILIEYNGKKYPINIKITTGDSSDNISSKLGMFYALTGKWPENEKGLTKWESYNTSLVKYFNPNTETDYYFIVYFKKEETFLFTSLKRLNTLVANGNNLPFQCKWSNNLKNTTRSQNEQCHYLMNVYFDSWIKKISGFEPLMRWKEGQK